MLPYPKFLGVVLTAVRQANSVCSFVQCVLHTCISSSRQQCSQFIVATVLTWCSLEYIRDKKLKVELSSVFIILHKDFKTWKC
jgi:hypothetical protein